MNDKVKILVGTLIFLALITSPIWYNMASGKAKEVLKNPKQLLVTMPNGKQQKLSLTEKAKKAKYCIEDTAFMRSRHMNLLNNWREEVVRGDNRVYTSKSGKKYNKSLSKTCLDCHSNKDKFCDVCHKYSGVNEPVCWSCHVFGGKK